MEYKKLLVFKEGKKSVIELYGHKYELILPEAEVKEIKSVKKARKK